MENTPKVTFSETLIKRYGVLAVYEELRRSGWYRPGVVVPGPGGFRDPEIPDNLDRMSLDELRTQGKIYARAREYVRDVLAACEVAKNQFKNAMERLEAEIIVQLKGIAVSEKKFHVRVQPQYAELAAEMSFWESAVIVHKIRVDKMGSGGQAVSRQVSMILGITPEDDSPRC